MTLTLDSILENIDTETANRLRSTLALVQSQSIGAESYRQQAKVWTKDDNSPVSITDLLHQTQLQDLIAHDFPEDGLIAEEPRSLQEEAFDDARKISDEHYDYELSNKLHHIGEKGDFTWVYDPIDGTKGYLKGRYYAIALGCFKGNEPAFGIMSVPHKGDGKLELGISESIAFAIPGKGAWIRKVSDSAVDAWQVLDTRNMPNNDPARLGMSLEHGGGVDDSFKQNNLERVKIDSQAKYLAVATGDLDAYVRQSRSDRPEDLLWDHLPGMLIAIESGAAVESFDGSAITPGTEKEIRFVGGMKCYRGKRDGDLSKSLKEILNG